MNDLRSFTLSNREQKNFGNPSARKKELKGNLSVAIKYLRDGKPMGEPLRDAIAGLIEDYVFPKPGPKGSSIDISELGMRADELAAVGMKAGEIDLILFKEFMVGDENDQSTVKRLRLEWNRVQSILAEFQDEWNSIDVEKKSKETE